MGVREDIVAEEDIAQHGVHAARRAARIRHTKDT